MFSGYPPALLTAYGNDLALKHPGVHDGDIPDGQAPGILAPAVLLLARRVSECRQSVSVSTLRVSSFYLLSLM